MQSSQLYMPYHAVNLLKIRELGYWPTSDAINQTALRSAGYGDR
jgi:hypothetical protein